MLCTFANDCFLGPCQGEIKFDTCSDTCAGQNAVSEIQSRSVITLNEISEITSVNKVPDMKIIIFTGKFPLSMVVHC